MPAGNISIHFASISDPRIERSKKHKLIDIITITICGVICGADGWVDVAMFGESKQEWLEGFLDLPNGIPSHDTFGDVFSRIDSVQFRECFIEWVRAVEELTKGQLISIDGKTVRRSHDSFVGKDAIHMHMHNGIPPPPISEEVRECGMTNGPRMPHLVTTRVELRSTQPNVYS